MQSRKKMLSAETLAAIDAMMDYLRISMQLKAEQQASFDEIVAAIQTNTVPQNLSIFYGRAPRENLKAYALLLAQELNFESEDIIFWLFYIGRYQLLSPSRVKEAVRYNFINPLNVTKILLAAALLTHKFNHDDYYANGDVALFAGLNPRREIRLNSKGKYQIVYISKVINELEIEFLNSVNFMLFIPAKNFISLARFLNIPCPEHEFNLSLQRFNHYQLLVNEHDATPTPELLSNCASTLFSARNKTARFQADSPDVSPETVTVKRFKNGDYSN